MCYLVFGVVCLVCSGVVFLLKSGQNNVEKLNVEQAVQLFIQL